MIELLWELNQTSRIEDLENDSIRAEAGARAEARNIAENVTVEYVRQLERLKLVNQAMWSLIKEQTALQDEDLLSRVTELDLQDGCLDGRVTKSAPDCPKCGAKMSRKFNRCLFCGEAIPAGDPFDTV